MARGASSMGIERLPIVCVMVNREARVIGASQLCLDALSLGKTEILTKEFSDLLAGSSRKYFNGVALPKLWESGVLTEVSCQFTKGKNKVMDALVSAVIDESKDFATIVVSDITARKKAAKRLRRSQGRFTRMLQLIPAGVVVLDRNLGFREFNPAALKILNCSENDLQTLHWSPLDWEFFYEAGQALDDKTLPPLMSLRNGVRVENRVVGMRRKGSHDTLWLLLSSEPFVDDDEEVEEVLVTFVDYSHQKQMTDYLEEAKEQAEIASQAKSDFLSVVSHELRTPLNGIIAPVQIMLDEIENEEHRTFLEMMGEGARRLLYVVEDLVDVARLREGKYRPISGAVELEQVLEETLAPFRAIAEQRKLKFGSVVSGNVPRFVRTDAQLLRRVVTCLVDNAFKFTEEGEIRVEAFFRMPDLLVVKVSDTGEGIDRKQIKGIFELFTQVDSSVTRSRGGLGVGLSLCRQVAKLLGGDIEVESEPGKGSVFTFSMKLEVDREAKVKAQVRGEIPQRILVVEDVALNRQVFEFMLSKMDRKPDFASTGKEALEKISKNEYDVVLLDINLPDLSGTQVLSEVMKAEERPFMIAQTAFAKIGDRENLLRLGFDDYISKPIRMSRLKRALQRTGEGVISS